MRKWILLALSWLLAFAIFASAEVRTRNEDAESQYELACYYYSQERDYDKAAEWMRSSAELGNADAAYELGKYYYTGQGVEKDIGKAIEWWQTAADCGNTAALRRLGYMYQIGDGVALNEVTAVDYYTKAADLGDPEALGMLGYCYSIGLGVEPDKQRSLEYYTLSADLGDAGSQTELGMQYFEAGEYEKAQAYLQAAADQNNAEAQYTLGYMFYDGVGVEKDPEQARRLWTCAAENGYPAAISALYYMDNTPIAEPLKLGDESPMVSELQQTLIAIGYLHGDPTGVYDEATETAVLLFQKEHDLEPTGIADPLTQAYLSFQDLTPYAARISSVSLQNAKSSPRLFVAFANAGDRTITKIVFDVLPLNDLGEPIAAFDYYDTYTCTSTNTLSPGQVDEKGFYWALNGCNDIAGVKIAITAVTFDDETEIVIPKGALNWIPFTVDR